MTVGSRVTGDGLRVTGRTIACAALIFAAAPLTAQAAKTGPVYTAPGGVTLRLILRDSTIGGPEVSMGELTFPPNSNSGEHVHGARVLVI